MPTLYTYGTFRHLNDRMCLTATKFKPFMFPTLGFVFAYVSNIHIIVIFYECGFVFPFVEFVPHITDLNCRIHETYHKTQNHEARSRLNRVLILQNFIFNVIINSYPLPV